jgi:carboxyl-terminal processing protease
MDIRLFWRTFFISLLIASLIGVAFLAGYYFHEQQFRAQQFPLLQEAYAILERHGLKEPPESPKMEYGMIQGMLQAYDEPHTIFLEPQQHELASQALEGKFGGIGAQLDIDKDGNWILFPYPDSPAKEAGIQDGDRLLKIEELVVTKHLNEDGIKSAIRGPINKNILLTIGRAPDYTPIEVAVKREEFPLPSVTWRLDFNHPWIGIIDINLIAASTADEIQQAVIELKGDNATHFILDLRDNPGGLLTAGVDIARLFLDKGVLMEQQYRDKNIERFKVNRRGPLTDLPLIVIINGGSASAAEIAAGALKAHKRADLIGEPSFGKDTIQLIFELEDGSSIRVTSAKWWIPGLESAIGENGLQPDILISPGEEGNGDDILQAAVNYWLERVNLE